MGISGQKPKPVDVPLHGRFILLGPGAIGQGSQLKGNTAKLPVVRALGMESSSLLRSPMICNSCGPNRKKGARQREMAWVDYAAMY